MNHLRETIGGLSAGVALMGGVLAGGADKPVGEMPGHVSFELVDDTRYETWDSLIGCIVTVERLQQEDVGTQVVPPQDCPADPNAIGPTALAELGSSHSTVYQRTDTGVAEVAPSFPAAKEALNDAKNDLAANRSRKIGLVALGTGLAGLIGSAAEYLARGRRSTSSSGSSS